MYIWKRAYEIILAMTLLYWLMRTILYPKRGAILSENLSVNI